MFLSEVPKNFAQSLEFEVNNDNFPKKVSPQKVFCGRSSVTILLKTFRQKSIGFTVQSAKKTKRMFFYHKKPQKILLDRLKLVLIKLQQTCVQSPKKTGFDFCL